MTAPYTRTWHDVLIELIRAGAVVGCAAFEPVGTLLVLYILFERREDDELE